MKSPVLTMLAAALCLASCAQNYATGGRNFTLVSAAEERAIGEKAAGNVLTSTGLYRPASPATLYVTDLCNKIYATTEAAAEPVQCNVLDTSVFNASATPGYMLVNRGLLVFLNSEAELAGVLGHEAGHLTARHISRSYTSQKVTSVLMGGAALAVAIASNDQALTQAAIAGGGLAAGVGLSAYGRSHETEADALGRRYMEKAGYNPQEMVNTVRAMKMYGDYRAQQNAAFNNGEIAPTSLLERLNSSHPATADRVVAAIAATGEPPVLKPEDDAGRRRYMQAIEGLVYGPPRRYGIARKAELVLPAQRIVVPMPADVTTDYIESGTADKLGTWLVAHPQSGAYVTITSVKVPAGRNPGTLIKSMLPAASGDIQRVQVGAATPSAVSSPDADHDSLSAQTDADTVTTGTIGYTATYRYLGNDKRYRIFAVPAPASVDDMLVLTLVYPNESVMTQDDDNLMAILRNMRFLTKAQALAYKPLQIHTFTAAGESVAHRASRLPTGGLNEDLFRAMNNLPQGTEMISGQMYKTILDPNPRSF